jgi:hypothetical protein
MTRDPAPPRPAGRPRAWSRLLRGSKKPPIRERDCRKDIRQRWRVSGPCRRRPKWPVYLRCGWCHGQEVDEAGPAHQGTRGAGKMLSAGPRAADTRCPASAVTGGRGLPGSVTGCSGYDAVMAGCGRARRGAAVLGCVALLGAGCAVGGRAAPAQKSAPRAAANSGLAIGSARRALGARYLEIAIAGNRRLNADFDPLEDRDRNDLARAKADLSDAAATERLFDRRLLRIVFPTETERVARLLYTVNQARARLTTAAAASASLRQLHAYEQRLTAANRPVEQAVRTIRRQLGLPPPATS